MENTEFLEKLKALTQTEDVLSVSREVNELKTLFEDYVIEEERKKQVAYLEAKDRGEDVEYEGDDLRDLKQEFYTIYESYKEQKNTVLKQQKSDQESNYAIKRSLLDRLRDLIENEDNIKTSYEVSKEVHEKWVATGEVLREKRQEIQVEYARLRDMFFTNMAIFKELREYDLKKNQQIKEEIIEKLKLLKDEENIKHAEETLKALQNEFDETGPVPREEWEKVRDAYWEIVKEIYQKIHDFYNDRRATLQVNIDKKTVLLEKVKVFVADNSSFSSSKEWEQATKTLIEFQDEWKAIGFGLKKQNEELWAELRNQCDIFFNNKRKFYEVIKDKFEENATKKRELIQQMETLKESTEWRDTTKKIIQLQNRWKQIGHAGQKNEQVLWKEFRNACDFYFHAKNKFFKELDAKAEENLKAKQVIIEAIKQYQPSKEKKQVFEDLKKFATDFNTVGKVPFKEKDKIYNEYKSALDTHYKGLKLEGEEKEKVMFQAQLSTLKAAPNSEELMDRARRDLQHQIQTLQQAATQYENNLGFFSNTDEKNPIIVEINQKIKNTKDKMEQLKLKLSLLNE